MKILIEVDTVNFFERKALKNWIKTMLKGTMCQRFKIKKLEIESLE